jgi:GDP-L-fucose synthase
VWDTSKPNGQPRRKLDVARAREYFGFEATTLFEDGLRETIRWYQSVSRKQESRSPEYEQEPQKF